MTWKVKGKGKKKTLGSSLYTETGGEDLRKDVYFEKFWRWYN